MGTNVTEFSRQIVDSYEKIVRFRKNIFYLPGNKTGQRFLELFIETIKWANGENESETIASKTNMVLIATCLQVIDRKASRKHNTVVLKTKRKAVPH